MIRPSIQARHALARLTLPVMVVASFGLMLVGKVDTILVERARVAVYDASAPIYAALAEPLGDTRKFIADVVELWGLREENARLRDENEKLRHWQSVALTLDAENRPFCCRSDPITLFTKARSHSMNEDWSDVSPRSEAVPRVCS
jgi:rod shape-determining protein MreC